MLSREVMGILALAILWVNALLVAGAAWKEIAALRARVRLLRPLAPGEPGVGLLVGEVIASDAAGQAFALHEVQQVGRQAADDKDRRAIAFSDRTYRGAVAGGTLRVGEAEVVVPAADDAEVWVAPAALAEAGASPGEAAFAAAYDEARKARGFARTVRAGLAVGDRVFAAGEVRVQGAAASLHPVEGGKLLVSSVDPRAECARRIRLLAAFLIAVPAVAGVCTAVALHPPHFGLVSTVGGALSLAYFLLVQPAGTAIRDRVRLPHQAPLLGSWVGAAPAGASARAPGRAARAAAK